MKSLFKLAVLLAMFTGWRPVNAAPADWVVKVNAGAVSSACLSTDATLTCFVPSSANKVNLIEEDSLLTITCTTKELCDGVKVGIEESGKMMTSIDVASVDAAGITKKFKLSTTLFSQQVSLGIFAGTELRQSFKVASAGAAPPAATSSQACNYEVELAGYPAGRDGRAAKSVTSAIVVDTLGNVVRKSTDFMFDENDRLEVWAIGPTSVVNKLEAKRTSGFRDISIVRVLGDGTVPKLPGGERQSTDPCITRPIATLTDFAPGRGVVEISSKDGGKITKVGEIDFQVHPLYVGMFTVGWINTKAVDPGFKLVNNGTQTVIASADISDKDNLYTLFVTPFVWGKRDPEKPLTFDSSIIDRINPSIGLVVDDIKNNVLLGVSIDLPAGVVLTFGKHYRRIMVLSPQSGLSVGSPFGGTAADLPTAKSWENDNFFGVSLDLRVMVKFIAALGSSGK